MKRSSLSVALAAGLSLTLAGTVQASSAPVAPSAEPVQELVGQGTAACPGTSLCLYEHATLNAAGPARVWVFPVAEARQDFTLRGHAAADKPSSAYMRGASSGPMAYLFPDYQCGFAGNREAEAIQFMGGDRRDSLNGVNGRAQRYGYFFKNGKWTKEKRWGITFQTLNLNDRAGCVSTGAWQNTYALRPAETGDM